MPAMFKSPADLEGYLFRIVDNGGETADRYTVVFSDGTYLGLSRYPSHPQGISMWGEDIDPATLQEWVDEGKAVDLALGDLPEGFVDHIIGRNNEGLSDFMRDLAAGEPRSVAASREGADENDGTHSCLGKGIYRTEDGYRVRQDGEPEDDPGPFVCMRKAALATLPTEYSLAGPEYHSTVEVMRMHPDAEVARRVAALEESHQEQPALMAC